MSHLPVVASPALIEESAWKVLTALAGAVRGPHDRRISTQSTAFGASGGGSLFTFRCGCCNNVAVGSGSRSGERAVHIVTAGAASETLAEGVIHLDPEPSVFDAMLQGWAAQMASRGLKRTTMQSALWLVRRFAAYTNDYPWHWQPADVDEFCAWLSSGKQPRAVSTLRGYQIQLSLFCEYVCDPRYGWLASCQERFGSQPQQVCTEQNRAQHVDNYEGDPGRRPLTPEELQAFFDYADEEVERIRQHGR